MQNKNLKKYPHYNVYTRLGYSQNVKGVGVFAIQPIKKGTFVFYGDNGRLITIKKDIINKLPKEIKKLYDDFCVKKNGFFLCPKNFNQLTVAWYLNHSKTPNIGSDKNYNFYALRNIKIGEELTTDYSTYSEEQLSWLKKLK